MATQKPDYIFIDNFKKFSLGNSSVNDILELKQLIYEYRAILFINLYNTDFVDDVVISITVKYFSDVIIDIKHIADDVYSLWTIKSLNIDYGVFSLKYDYKHFDRRRLERMMSVLVEQFGDKIEVVENLTDRKKHFRLKKVQLIH
ncbi:MAG: hypothetical protein L6V95_11200 [Candidatus Melainabacteria bacterium]|nr:MAG: hypothetical protein L6V95_11200 [Candidatus Melainabacteria bacterium]